MLPLKLKPAIFTPDPPRSSCSGAAVAGTGLSVSFRVPGARAEAAEAEPNPVQRLCHDRARQQGDRPLGPHGHGPGRLSRHRHAGGRGAGGRLRPDGGGRRRRQPEALRQPRLGRRRAGHRRLVGDVLVVRPLPQGRRARPRHAGQCRRRGSGTCRPARSRSRRACVSHASGKQATFGELADAAAKEQVPAEVALKPRDQWKLIGSEDFRRIDSREKPTGTAALHHRREAARHADGDGGPSAAVRRQGEELRRRRRPRR